LVFVNLLQKGLGVVRTVVFHHLRRIAVIDEDDILAELATDSFIQFLEELQSTALYECSETIRTR
jgi:hypothetical protein